VFERPEEVYTSGDGDGGGGPAQLDLDLTWTTDGTPYHYDLTTRYEIPCTVVGTVTVDGVPMAVNGQGQRDHSWGVRDWWAFGWCWSSACLGDGTRVHLADIRMPGFPLAFGYVQSATGRDQGGTAYVRPITELSVSEKMGAHGFPTSARIELAAGETADGPADGTADGMVRLAIVVTPLAYGPVLFRNDDGRVSRFPRAMVHYAVEDGREGMGWIEWNQPES
jgi:hypothetical protein